MADRTTTLTVLADEITTGLLVEPVATVGGVARYTSLVVDGDPVDYQVVAFRETGRSAAFVVESDSADQILVTASASTDSHTARTTELVVEGAATVDVAVGAGTGEPSIDRTTSFLVWTSPTTVDGWWESMYNSSTSRQYLIQDPFADQFTDTGDLDIRMLVTPRSWASDFDRSYGQGIMNGAWWSIVKTPYPSLDGRWLSFAVQNAAGTWEGVSVDWSTDLGFVDEEQSWVRFTRIGTTVAVWTSSDGGVTWDVAGSASCAGDSYDGGEFFPIIRVAGSLQPNFYGGRYNPNLRYHTVLVYVDGVLVFDAGIRYASDVDDMSWVSEPTGKTIDRTGGTMSLTTYESDSTATVDIDATAAVVAHTTGFVVDATEEDIGISIDVKRRFEPTLPIFPHRHRVRDPKRPWWSWFRDW